MAVMRDGRGLGLECLLALPTVRAEEFANWGQIETAMIQPAGGGGSAPLLNEREFRFLKAVIETPFQPSSSYAKLAGMSSKTALCVRQRLLSTGFIREHRADSGKRGRSSILLEALSAGVEAASQYEGTRRSGT